MRHFDKSEWMLFSSSLTDEHTKAEMEEHLKTCDTCLETYLSVLEGTGLQSIHALIPPEFSDSVMKQIGSAIEAGEKRGRNTPRLPDTFIYYAAAACITLLFTFSGVFQSLCHGFPQAASRISRSPSGLEKVLANGWTERLTNGTTIFFDEFKPKKHKE